MKPLVPERDSSLYECFSSSTQNQQIYNTFRPLNRPSSTTTTTTTTTNVRLNSNCSSNEADEESSLSSLNSNHLLNLNSNEDNLAMSTFKTNLLPSKPSDIKRKSNHRKQIYATLNLNNNNNNNTSPSSSSPPSLMINENETNTSTRPPPPPPPLPNHFDIEKRTKNESDFQSEIEQAKTRLKKVTNVSKVNSPG